MPHLGGIQRLSPYLAWRIIELPSAATSISVSDSLQNSTRDAYTVTDIELIL